VAAGTAAPHWSIGDNNGVPRVDTDSSSDGVRQTCGDRSVTSGAVFSSPATSPVAISVAATSRTSSHRTTAHIPHSRPSSPGRTVHSPAGVRIVAWPASTETSPAVTVANAWYGTPASWDGTSRQRSRRPNMPCVHPWEGSARSAASTAAAVSGDGSGGWPVGRPSAARTRIDSPGLSSPVAAW
jgi:hypothetical protein